MAEPITPERLKAVVAAWHRSLSERLEMGENALIAWGAVPDLAAEVDRLKAELADLEGQNALTESHFNNHVAESIVEQNALTKRAEAAEAEVVRLKADNAHLDREWVSRGVKVVRLDEELRQARNRLWEVAKTRVWTNEDGKGFVFAEDLRSALGEAVSG